MLNSNTKLHYLQKKKKKNTNNLDHICVLRLIKFYEVLNLIKCLNVKMSDQEAVSVVSKKVATSDLFCL